MSTDKLQAILEKYMPTNNPCPRKRAEAQKKQRQCKRELLIWCGHMISIGIVSATEPHRFSSGGTIVSPDEVIGSTQKSEIVLLPIQVERALSTIPPIQVECLTPPMPVRPEPPADREAMNH